MGDILDDDQFLADEASDDQDNDSSVQGDEESAVDYLEESGDEGVDHDSDEDEEDEDGNNGGASSEDKKRKRKEKFAELKAKRRKLMEMKQQEEVALHIVQESDSEANMQLQPEEMLLLIEEAKQRHRLVPEEYTNVHFDIEHFFYPAIEATSVTESATKKLSPFVRALSATLPNYRKLLTAEGCKDVKSEDFGSPLVVIVTASAIRATEIIQGLHAKIHHCKLAKLFSKHIKITEQIATLASSYHPIVIGTPHRLHQLIELGALSLNRTQLLMVDFTADIKNFTILTLPGVNQDFGKLLFQYAHPQREHLRTALIKDKPLPPDTKPKKTPYNKHGNKNKKGGKPFAKKPAAAAPGASAAAPATAAAK